MAISSNGHPDTREPLATARNADAPRPKSILFSGLALLLLVISTLPARAAEPLIERGGYLVNTIMACGNCHTPIGPDGPIESKALAGRFLEKNPAFTAYASNITPAGPSGAWSDLELKVAIREGLRPDGSVIGPPMPYQAYRGISDDDLDAIVAYLRSVPAVANAVPASEYSKPLPPNYGPRIESVRAPDPEDQAALGEYLGYNLGHCIECHSPASPRGPDIWERPGQGGFLFQGPWGTSVSSNITADALERYSDSELAKMITEGIRPDGSAMAPPMPYAAYSKMTDQDLSALLVWLRGKQ